ncbi:hypothetical protein WKK05_26325 [Nostoc sp. UHCC 0302]|uniref:hypothetical protein n=1 Tax=Nostoc sp. UHCC 0302 TaxID=3134896 RepID=UPI00311CD573
MTFILIFSNARIILHSPFPDAISERNLVALVCEPATFSLWGFAEISESIVFYLSTYSGGEEMFN